MIHLPDSLSQQNGGPEALLPGTLVRHRRYEYRGVIVSVDPECLADDVWYYSNNTQPEKQKPWYHVLVDNTAQTTYTAHSSIEEDPAAAPISHPLTSMFFERFEKNRYIRNDRPWPNE